jgi:hypothetical protein
LLDSINHDEEVNNENQYLSSALSEIGVNNKLLPLNSSRSNAAIKPTVVLVNHHHKKQQSKNYIEINQGSSSGYLTIE